MKINLSSPVAFAVALLLCGGCHKSVLEACTGNCEVVSFSGIAVDPGAQKPLANLPVTVTMPLRQSCLWCDEYEVVRGSTKGDGTFALTTKVDTSLVFPRYCTITVHAPANYISFADPRGPGIISDGGASLRAFPLSLDSTGTAPYLEYDFFQSTLLTIQLHRTGAIVPSEPTLGLTFTVGAESTSVWGLDETPTNADTSVTVNTGANVFTKVSFEGFVTDSTRVSRTDSIRCVAGASNTIQVSYP